LSSVFLYRNQPPYRDQQSLRNCSYLVIGGLDTPLENHSGHSTTNTEFINIILFISVYMCPKGYLWRIKRGADMEAKSEKLTAWQKIGYGLGDIYGGGSCVVISFYYLIFLTDVVRISPPGRDGHPGQQNLRLDHRPFRGYYRRPHPHQTRTPPPIPAGRHPAGVPVVLCAVLPL